MTTPKRARPEPTAILRGHTASVTSVRFLRTRDTCLLSGDEKGAIRLWDTRLEECVLVHRSPSCIPPSPIQCFAQSPVSDGDSVLVQSKNGFVRRIHLAHDEHVFDTDGWKIASSRFHSPLTPSVPGGGSVRDGDLAAIPVLPESFCGIEYIGADVWTGPFGNGDESCVYDERSGDLEARFKIGDAACGMLMCMRGVKRADDASMCREIVAGYEDGTLARWDIRFVSEPVARISVGKQPVLSVGCHPRGRVCVAGGGFRDLVAVGDLNGGCLEVLERCVGDGKGIADVVWSEDGRVVVTGGWEGGVRVWDGRRRKGRLLRRIVGLKWHIGSVLNVGIGGGLLASGGKDKTIGVWRIGSLY